MLGIGYECPQAREKLAYLAQASAGSDRSGRSLEQDFDIDPLNSLGDDKVLSLAVGPEPLDGDAKEPVASALPGMPIFTTGNVDDAIGPVRIGGGRQAWRSLPVASHTQTHGWDSTGLCTTECQQKFNLKAEKNPTPRLLI